MRSIALAVLFLTLAGCAQDIRAPAEVKMYDGPAQTGREVRLEARATGGQIQIWQVDGQKPVGGLAGLDHQARAVWLLPGKHYVTAKFNSGTWFAYSRDLWFVGEPGKAYFVVAEPAASNALVGTTAVRFFIQDGMGRRVGGIKGSPEEPDASATAAAPAAASIRRPPGCRQLSFTDGSSACMEEFEALSVAIGMPGGISFIDRAHAARTIAYAITDTGMGCKATSAMWWNNPNPGGNDGRARQECETFLKKDARNPDGCRCATIIPTDGNVPMAQKEFVAAVFRYYYLLLDSYRASDRFQSQWGEIDQLKRTLEADEQAHYRRLAGATN